MLVALLRGVVAPLVLILTVLSNGLNQIGAADYTQTIIKGLVIIVAAVFTMASQRKLIVK